MSDADPHAPNALTALVQAARSGLRRDVRALIEGLPAAQFMVALQRPMPELTAGKPVEVDQELAFTPHFLPGQDHRPLFPFFTHFAPLDRIVPALGWQTDGGPLQLFALPALQALRVAYRLVDIWNIRSLVLDAGAPSELLLTRDEISSILDGKAIPLVAYSHVGRSDTALNTEPPSPGLIRAVNQCLQRQKQVQQHRLERIFDEERDLRPRLMLRIWADESANREALVRAVGDAVQNELMTDGDLQVRFEA